MNKKTIVTCCLSFLTLITMAWNAKAEPFELKRLQEAYPESIQNVSSKYISWKDGTRTPVRDSFSFANLLASLFSRESPSESSISIKDLHCDTYEPFFRKMYGNSAAEVKKKLVTIYWMPNIFGTRYPLKVTTVNGIDKRIQRISEKLEKLPRAYLKYLANPAGAFYWRTVKNEDYLSSHSFGIAMDINSHYGNYWLWDLEKEPVIPSTLTYRNNVPMEIVNIFEQEGFLWGGRWYYYDTMHFEYRPEVFIREADGLHYNHRLGGFCRRGQEYPL